MGPQLLTSLSMPRLDSHDTISAELIAAAFENCGMGAARGANGCKAGSIDQGDVPASMHAECGADVVSIPLDQLRQFRREP